MSYRKTRFPKNALLISKVHRYDYHTHRYNFNGFSIVSGDKATYTVAEVDALRFEGMYGNKHYVHTEGTLEENVSIPAVLLEGASAKL